MIAKPSRIVIAYGGVLQIADELTTLSVCIERKLGPENLVKGAESRKMYSQWSVAFQNAAGLEAQGVPASG